jgi:hypothetical protein
MKRLTIIILVAFTVVTGLSMPVRAELVTKDAALRVANNWITLMIQKRGDWGGSTTAAVDEIQPFTSDGRTIGYFCRVRPQGHIIISLRRELVPVKAFSDTCNLNPDSDEGLPGLLKGCMERIVKQIEEQVGPIATVKAAALVNIMEKSHLNSWAELEQDSQVLQEEPDSWAIAMNYVEGLELLCSSWHQGDPYNRDCPAPPPGDDCAEPRCLVGCVATAAAQIMRYWAWPPEVHDWLNMPNAVTGSSPAVQINAVADLCRKIGILVRMGYCAGSGCQSRVPTEDMEGVYEGYLYSDYCVKLIRREYSPGDWWNLIKEQLNSNQPIQYRVINHSIVADGWVETGATPSQYYHMNYGWAKEGECWEGCNTWYALDLLYLGSLEGEYMLVNIFPVTALRHTIEGVYPKEAFNYRYFNQDATADNGAFFRPGQNLQFLPGVKVTCTSPRGIIFDGDISDNTRLFSIKETKLAGIRIYNGVITLFQNGSIKFHKYMGQY